MNIQEFKNKYAQYAGFDDFEQLLYEKDKNSIEEIDAEINLLMEAYEFYIINNKTSMTDVIEMVFGDKNTVFKEFDDDSEHEEYSGFDKSIYDKNDGKVKLTGTGFPDEWREAVDYDKSYAFIKDEKLNVIVYGIPEWINPKSVKKYYESTLEQYIKQGYGEFFELKPHCPLCMIVIRNGEEVIV